MQFTTRPSPRIGTAARSVLASAAWLDPDGIPVSLLAPATKLESDSLLSAVRTLDRFRLFQYDASTTSVSLHRITQTLARTAPESRSAHKAVVAALAEALPAGLWSMPRPSSSRRSTSWSSTSSQRAKDPWRTRSRSGSVSCCNTLASRQAQRARFTSALDGFLKSLSLAAVGYGPHSVEVALRLSSVATVHRSLGRLGDAEIAQRQALAIFIDEKGETSRDVAICLDNLGMTLRGWGPRRCGGRVPALVADKNVGQRTGSP